MGKPDEARQALDRARSASGSSQISQVRLQLAMTAARIEAAAGKPAEALRALSRAYARNHVGTQLEELLGTRCLVGELEIASGNAAAGRAHIAAVAKEAAAKAFQLVARKARKSLAKSASS